MEKTSISWRTRAKSFTFFNNSMWKPNRLQSKFSLSPQFYITGFKLLQRCFRNLCSDVFSNFLLETNLRVPVFSFFDFFKESFWVFSSMVFVSTNLVTWNCFQTKFWALKCPKTEKILSVTDQLKLYNLRIKKWESWLIFVVKNLLSQLDFSGIFFEFFFCFSFYKCPRKLETASFLLF